MMMFYQTAKRWIWFPLSIVALGIVQIAFWWYDSAPPFAVLGIERLERVHPGQTVRISAHVLRDIRRNCDATMRRAVFDSGGYRYDIAGEVFFTAESIAKMDQMAPGKLTVAIDVPPGLLPGPAVVISQIEYQCNPLQRLFPITILTELPFEVIQ